MRRKAAAAAALALWVGSGCNKLSEDECAGLRTQAFDVINNDDKKAPHTCNDDSECMPTEWPLCPKPVNNKNYERIAAIKKRFDDGSCKEPAKECRETPEVYCKQGLCVFREKPGGENPVDAQ